MKDFEITGFVGGDWVTFGHGRSYTAAVLATRRRAAVLRELIQRARVIRVYVRPDHQWGAHVPAEALLA